jgi:hypothetical protein
MFQLGGIEALSEPVVDVGENSASLLAPIGVTQEPRKRGKNGGRVYCYTAQIRDLRLICGR